jgi:hypothetical protein
MTILNRTPAGHYRSDTVLLHRANDLTPGEAEALIGKTIAHVTGREFGLSLRFTDGSELDVRGHTYGDSSLDVSLKPP